MMLEVSLYYFIGSCSFDLFDSYMKTNNTTHLIISIIYNLAGIAFFVWCRQQDKKQWIKEGQLNPSG